MFDVSESDSDVVILPTFFGPEFRRRLGHGLWLLPLVLVGFTQTSVRTTLWSVAGVAAFTVVAYTLSAEFLGHSSLGIVDGTIRRTSWLRRPASCPRSAISRVIEIPLLVTRLSPPETWLLFVGREDETVLRAYAGYYPPEELARFRAALSLPWDSVERLTPAQARHAVRGSFPWPAAHYWLTGLGLLVAAYLVAVIVLAVLEQT